MIPYEGLLCGPEWPGQPGVPLTYRDDQDTEERRERRMLVMFHACTTTQHNNKHPLRLIMISVHHRGWRDAAAAATFTFVCIRFSICFCAKRLTVVHLVDSREPTVHLRLHQLRKGGGDELHQEAAVRCAALKRLPAS